MTVLPTTHSHYLRHYNLETIQSVGGELEVFFTGSRDGLRVWLSGSALPQHTETLDSTLELQKQ